MKASLEFNARPAKNYWYGNLYYHLTRLFASFHRQLRKLPTAWSVFHVHVWALPMVLSEQGFDRIDVSIK
jgi:hypothetical protein